MAPNDAQQKNKDTAASAKANKTATAQDPKQLGGLLGSAAAEFLGTFVLLFVGLGTLMWSGLLTQDYGYPVVPLTFGAILIGLMVAFSKVSGGHFNPAISLAALIAGRTSGIQAALNVVGQLLGAVTAWLIIAQSFGALSVLKPQPAAETGMQGQAQQRPSTETLFPVLANGYSSTDAAAAGGRGLAQLQLPLLNAFLLETIVTAILAGVFLAAAKPNKPAVPAAVAVGLSYAGLFSVMFLFTGAGMNPARSLTGAMLAGGDAWSQLWLFIVAPLMGAVIAGLVYRGFVKPAGDGVNGQGFTGEEATEFEGTIDGKLKEEREAKKLQAAPVEASDEDAAQDHSEADLDQDADEDELEAEASDSFSADEDQDSAHEEPIYEELVHEEPFDQESVDEKSAQETDSAKETSSDSSKPKKDS